MMKTGKTKGMMFCIAISYMGATGLNKTNGVFCEIGESSKLKKITGTGFEYINRFSSEH